jgi:1-acyl-sn-glycerol-3-phosphate acyltransferase
MGNIKVQIDRDVFYAFRQLKGKRAIVCPNHPAAEDGLFIFGLSAIMKERFAFLTARDSFGKAGKFQANTMQKLGCYSVERGMADLHAFKASCKILKRGKCKLVIFPEGEISYKNSYLRRFESGPELIALSTLHEIQNNNSTETVYILPLALRYRYSKDIRRHLSRVMRRVEYLFGITGEELELKQRIRHAFEYLLLYLENKYSIKSTTTNLNKRILAFCEARVSAIAAQVSSENSDKLSLIRRIHLLMNRLAEIESTYNDSADDKLQRKRIKKLYEQVKNLIGFMAVSEHSFSHDLSQEDAAELIKLLVQELPENIKVKKPDIVLVGAGRLLDVREFMPSNQSQRKESVYKLKRELEHQIANRLAQLDSTFRKILTVEPELDETGEQEMSYAN